MNRIISDNGVVAQWWCHENTAGQCRGVQESQWGKRISRRGEILGNKVSRLSEKQEWSLEVELSVIIQEIGGREKNQG